MSDALPNLGVVDLGVEFSLDLDTFLKKPYDDIGEAAVELPAIIEWVNQQLQWVIEQRGSKKQDLKVARARSFVSLRNGAAAGMISGKVTEQAIEHLIELDPVVCQTNEELSKILGWASRLSNLQYVLQSKLDLVRSTESTRRKLLNDGENNDNE